MSYSSVRGIQPVRQSSTATEFIVFALFTVVELCGCRGSGDSQTKDGSDGAESDGPASPSIPDGAPISVGRELCARAMDEFPCDDGNPCTRTDKCRDGICVGGDPLLCETTDPCLTVGQCDPDTGQCTAGTPAAAGTSCDDGSACTSNDACADGVCLGGKAVVCGAAQCREAGVCDPSTGACSEGSAIADGTACDDQDACSSNDRCQAGACLPGTRVRCDPEGPCQQSICDPASGTCRRALPLADGTICDDADLCTTVSSCLGGVCVARDRKVCSGSNPCGMNGACDGRTGQCTEGPVIDGTTCDDGNPCTVADACKGGICSPGSPLQCPTPTICRAPSTCNPASGTCVAGPPRSEGAECDDGNPCTHLERCLAGICGGGSAVACDGAEACKTGGSCNPATGKCSDPAALPDGTVCSDGDPCTREDVCRSGNCIGGAPLTCRPQNVCEASSSCARASGMCQVTPRSPRLDPQATPLRQGEPAFLTGAHLSGARVLLGTRELAAHTENDGRLRIEVPRDHPLGVTEITATTDCGVVKVLVEILVARPKVLLVDPPAVAPDGMLIVSLAERSDITSIQIGGETITSLGPANFRWHPNGSAVFAVRVPMALATQVKAGNTVSVAMRVSGAGGSSDPLSIALMSPSPIRPPSPTELVFLPTRLTGDTTYPLGTMAPYGQGSNTPVSVYSWIYPLNTQGTCGEGTIDGTENGCLVRPGCDWHRRCPDSPDPRSACHPIQGRYRVGSTVNHVEFTIDRTSTGGIVEHYVGGWTSMEDPHLPPPTHPVARVDAYLTVRSRETGIQLSIKHGLRPGCADLLR